MTPAQYIKNGWLFWTDPCGSPRRANLRGLRMVRWDGHRLSLLYADGIATGGEFSMANAAHAKEELDTFLLNT